MSTLKPHQVRVVEEHEQLETKIKALGLFMAQPEFFALPMDEKLLLSRQARFMNSYAMVLRERISGFTP